MGLFADLLGTLSATFQIGKAGVKLKNNSAVLEVKAADGTTDAPVTASKINVSGDAIDLNSDAAGSAADWKYTLQRPASGMSEAVTLTLPVNNGTASQVLQTDGDGVLSWASAGVTDALDHVDTTTLAFDTSSPEALFTKPANALITKVQVIIDTPFNGTAPTLSIGIAGTVSKYMATTQVDLKGTATDVYEVCPGLPASAEESLIATYSADSSSAGSARILIYYTTPA